MKENAKVLLVVVTLKCPRYTGLALNALDREVACLPRDHKRKFLKLV